MTTGEIKYLFETCAPGNGATLVTAGDIVFWGDLARNFRAIDADSGKVLVADRASRKHSEQHDHVCRQWQAVRCGADGTRRHYRRPDYAGRNYSGAREHERSLRFRAAVE